MDKPNDFQKVQLVTVDADQAGQRLDNFLVAALKGVPKSHVYRLIRKGEVRVNKKRVKALYRLQSNDVVRIPPVRLEPTEQNKVPSSKLSQLEDSILYESEQLMVINKPSGMAVHGGSGLSFGVIEALRQLRPQQRYLELVHRLDRDTSGCLLIAKKRSALRLLHRQLREKTLYKEYVALVDGTWPRRVSKVDVPLHKNQLKSGERMVRVSEEGKPSQTVFRIERRFTKATLVQAKPITGRTHQIRVHAQYIGHPLLGDPKYGNDSSNKWFKDQYGLNRLFLHARMLRFVEKEDGEPIEVTAEYDAVLSQVVEGLSVD